MKIIEEKARKYAGVTPEVDNVKNLRDYPGAQHTLNKYYSFIEGYKSAFDWISVEDSLPEKGIPVLIKQKSNSHIFLGKMSGAYFIDAYNRTIGGVGYWRYVNFKDAEL